MRTRQLATGFQIVSRFELSRLVIHQFHTKHLYLPFQVLKCALAGFSPWFTLGVQRAAMLGLPQEMQDFFQTNDLKIQRGPGINPVL